MTDTDRAVDDAERAREQGGGAKRFGLPSAGSWTARLSPRWLPDELGVLVVLALLVAGIGIPYPDFLDSDNLLTTAHNSVYISLMACGMVFALAMREVDLSVGGSYAMCLVVGALLVREGVEPWLAVPVMLLTGTALGVFNALVTTLLALPSFIVTLGTLMLFRGIGLTLADGKQITDLPLDDSFFTLAGGDLGGVPFALWVLLAVTAVLTVVLARTRFGSRVRAIGSNPDAATFSGIPVVRTRVQALALSGLTTACASVLALAYYGAGDPTLGQGYELQAIAACIIGGTPLAGGRGSVVGAVAGALILSVVASGLVFFEVPINWTSFATGAVILVAVAADSALRRRGRRRENRRQ
ncbi:ABC transporter permease [Streptomyces sp. NPDC057621]|uniref:ABC transporter permease n=1 Tax=Streptomyces sp. NPDC057621 TaxID=3346186 RepID=UPI0036752C3D